MTENTAESPQLPCIPQIIHFSLPGKPDHDAERRIQKARELHTGWEIRIWRDPLDPELFRLSHLWQTVNSGAQLADLIRIEVVYQSGGFYFDSDFNFHRSLEPLRHNSFVIASCGDGTFLANAFFGATSHHAALEELILDLSRLERLPKEIPPNESTGPYFFAQWLRWRDDVTVIPRELIYPYNWNEAPKAASSAAFATHLWSGSWLKKKQSPSVYQATRANLIRTLDKAADRLLSRYGAKKGAYSMDSDLMVQTAHGHKIVASGSDISITPTLALTGYYERSDELFVKQLVKGGDWCIDVGANIGVFSLLFAACVGPFGRVFAFEPNTAARKYLEKSAVLNWMHDRIRISDLAVGSECGTGPITFSAESLGGATLFAQSPLQSRARRYAGLATETHDVGKTRLDTFFPDWAVFSCVKIDVEGHEPEVLKGCRRLFEEKRINCLIIECLPELGREYFSSLVGELRHIALLGYNTGVASQEGGFIPVPFERLIHSLQPRNWIFIQA